MLEKSHLKIIKTKRINCYTTQLTIDNHGDESIIECCDIYPGVQVIYNHFRGFLTPQGQENNDFIEINHCLRGKFECLYNQKYYVYLGEGDLSISRWNESAYQSSFPLGYYEGIEILIDVSQAKQCLLFKQFHIDVERLGQKLTDHHNISIFRSTKQIQHICLEMYDIEEDIKLDYLKIKILELLLFLAYNDFQIVNNQRCYYPRGQIETIKAIKAYMIDHLSSQIDFQQLANQYNINIHTLRKSFKEIYGIPIYQWFKEYRLEYSAKLLKETDLPIIDIANQVGYSNPSKYSSAFYQYMMLTPQQYRKSNIKMD